MPLDLQLILASTSPRRVQLLKQMGLDIRCIAPDCDEKLIRGETPRNMVLRLAREKALSVATSGRLSGPEHRLVIAADTTVVSPSGRILGKPTDAASARRMLGQLCGKTHTVLSAYALVEVDDREVLRVHSRCVSSRVSLRRLSKADIAAYVATGEPMDKAGSYAAQGLGMALVEKISGSYTNVVGLPMSQLLSDLEEKFGVPLFGGPDR